MVDTMCYYLAFMFQRFGFLIDYIILNSHHNLRYKLRSILNTSHWLDLFLCEGDTVFADLRIHLYIFDLFILILLLIKSFIINFCTVVNSFSSICIPACDKGCACQSIWPSSCATRVSQAVSCGSVSDQEVCLS